MLWRLFSCLALEVGLRLVHQGEVVLFLVWTRPVHGCSLPYLAEVHWKNVRFLGKRRACSHLLPTERINLCEGNLYARVARLGTVDMTLRVRTQLGRRLDVTS